MKDTYAVLRNNNNMSFWDVRSMQDQHNLNLNDEGEYAFDVDPPCEIELAMQEVDESYFEFAQVVPVQERLAAQTPEQALRRLLHCLASHDGLGNDRTAPNLNAGMNDLEAMLAAVAGRTK